MSNSRDSGNSFLLDLGNRIFHLNADNEEDLNKWIKAIEASKENAQEVTASITGKPKYVKKLIQLFDTNGKNALNKKISDKFKEKTKNLTTYPETLKDTLEELLKLTEDMVETIDGCISHIPQRLDIAEIYAQTFHKMLCEFLSKLWKDSYSELTSESLLQLIIWTGQYDAKLRSVGINDQRVYSGISLLSAEFSMKFFEDTSLAIYESIKKAAFGQVETEVNTGRYVVCYKELCSYIEPVFIEIQNCALPQFAEKALEVIREVVYTYINAVTEICERNLVVPMICVAGFCNDTVMIIEKFKSWQIKAKSTLDASLINLHLRTRETTSSIVSLEKMVKDFFALSLIDRINDSFELPFNELHMEILFPQIAKELNSLENFAERNLINYVWRCLMEVVIQKYVNCIFSNKKAMKTQSVLLLSETLRSDGDMFKKYFCAKFEKAIVEKQLQSLYDIVDFLEALPSDIVSACEKVKKTQGQDFDFLTAKFLIELRSDLDKEEKKECTVMIKGVLDDMKNVTKSSLESKNELSYSGALIDDLEEEKLSKGPDRKDSHLRVTKAGTFQNMKGYLQKKNKQKILNWDERFFSIKNDRLYWYKTHKALQPLNSVSLADFTLDYKGKKPLRFNITNTERTIKLLANNSEDKEKWLKALQKPKDTEITVTLLKETSEESIFEDFNRTGNSRKDLMKVANKVIAEIPKKKKIKVVREEVSDEVEDEDRKERYENKVQSGEDGEQKNALAKFCKCFDFLKKFKKKNPGSEPLIIN